MTTFTMSELQDGLVQYVRRFNRSSHDRIPLHDSFDVFVSDGRQNSSVGKVEIAFNRSNSERLDSRDTVLTAVNQDANQESSRYPILTTRSVVRVAYAGSVIITRNNLRATDNDSDDQQVSVIIISYEMK